VSDTASRSKEQTQQIAAEAGAATRQVAESAQEQAATVAHDAGDQARHVMAEAKTQTRAVAADAREQLREQAEAQTARVAETMRRISGEFHALAAGRPEEAGAVRDYLDEACGRLEHFAGRVESQGFEGIVDDVQRFARRRPGAFLVAAGAAGFLAGRMFRSVKDADGAAQQATAASNGGRGMSTFEDRYAGAGAGGRSGVPAATPLSGTSATGGYTAGASPAWEAPQ
jgi:hypothetical protein